ncbi:MAG: hypothetical protein CMO73_07690 [Verrucomicrobiales bacterium]|nr:hypothetical protein [Verrucomicrobiales bacterium]
MRRTKLNNLRVSAFSMVLTAFTWALVSYVLGVFSYANEEPRVITLEGEVVEGKVESISSGGLVRIKDLELPLDGLRSIIPDKRSEVTDHSEGKVILICGSEFSASQIRLIDEAIVFNSPGIGNVEVPIDAVRALRFGKLRRGSRFQKGLLNWEATKEVDSIFISGGSELQEVDGLIEEIDGNFLVFDRDQKLQTVPLNRAYGVVLASPLLKENERPACVLSLIGGTRIKADIEAFDGKMIEINLVEDVNMKVSWELVKRIGLKSARLEYLSDLDVLKEVIRPVIAFKRPWQRDLTVTGLPIKIKDQIYDRGLGFSSGTYVTFPNEGPYDLFIAEIGIDDDTLGRGDCEFVVRGGSQELFRKRVRGGDPAQLIKVDITGHDQVTLEVDPGEDLDIADHADWADACFLQTSK